MPPQPAGNRVTGLAGTDHRVRRPAHRAGAVAGGAAAAVAVGVGSATLLSAPSPTPSAGTGPTAERITVSTTAPAVPLSPAQIADLLSRRPDLGVFDDAQRRAACLNGLGYPASATVLGGEPVDLAGRRAELIVLPGGAPTELTVLVVPPNCNAADSGLIADTRIPRP